MSAETIAETRRPRAFETILLGGLIAGVLDGLDAVVFYDLFFGVTLTALFQHIASGLLGAKSFRGGWFTGRVWPFLRSSAGLGFVGEHSECSCTFSCTVVLPSSAVTKRTVPVAGFEVLDQLFSHTMFVGLPIALMARRSARS